MATERITAAAVTAELDVLDGQEKVVAGQVVVTIGFTNAAVKDLAPREHEELASYLFALLDREPVKGSPAYAAHRIVLGSLATELRGFAVAAGVPVGLQADLRAASTQAEERRIRERIADQQASAHRYYDDAISEHQRRRERDDHIPDEPETQPDEEDQTPDATDAAPVSTETDDDLAFL